MGEGKPSYLEDSVYFSRLYERVRFWYLEFGDLSRLRRELGLQLRKWDRPADHIDTVLLVASELASNALRHGELTLYTPDRLQLTLARVDDLTWVSAWDPSKNGLPWEITNGTGGAENGRGLFLVSELCRIGPEWQWSTVEGGKWVSALVA
jgi:two-component sensor histidine kinase